MQPALTKTSTNQNYQGSVNPFARALSETEKISGRPNASQADLAQTFSSGLMQPPLSAEARQQQETDRLRREQQQRLLEAEKKRRRQKLHERINPVETTDVFSARKREVAKQIEKLRAELQALVQDVKKFHQEVEVSLLSQVTDPGENGAYYLNFFQKLRQLIILLRKKISSARTWATQMNAKSKKKKARKGKRPGLEIAGTKSEKTSTVFDMMHHERSNAYGGS